MLKLIDDITSPLGSAELQFSLTLRQDGDRVNLSADLSNLSLSLLHWNDSPRTRFFVADTRLDWDYSASMKDFGNADSNVITSVEVDIQIYFRLIT